MSDLTVDISAVCAEWPDIAQLIEDIAIKTCGEIGIRNSEVSIVLADNAFIRILNREYRGKDKPTNVLSFPADEPGLLGDVILAYETVRQEALEQGKDFNHHVTHLIVHGILHLAGHDHEEEIEAEKMEALEIRILQFFGVKDPYEL